MKVIVTILSFIVGFWLARLILYAVRFAILGCGAVGGYLFIGREAFERNAVPAARPSIRVLAAPIWFSSLLLSVGFAFLILWTLWVIATLLGWRTPFMLLSPVAWIYFTLSVAIIRLSAASSRTAWVVMTHGLGRLRGSAFLFAVSLAILIVYGIIHDFIFPIQQKGHTIMLRMVFNIFDW